MALTEAQKVKVRYYCGYGMIGQQALPANGYRFFTQYGEMEYKLINMQAEEESEVINYYIPNLDELKADMPAIRDNLDTKQAAVWIWNDKEFPNRRALCNFLGLTPGPGLSSGGMQFAV
jgi:hypothetical protein